MLPDCTFPGELTPFLTLDVARPSTSTSNIAAGKIKDCLRLLPASCKARARQHQGELFLASRCSEMNAHPGAPTSDATVLLMHASVAGVPCVCTLVVTLLTTPMGLEDSSHELETVVAGPRFFLPFLISSLFF